MLKQQCTELGKRICEKAMEVSNQIKDNNPKNMMKWVDQTNTVMNNIRESIFNEFGYLSEMDESVLADIYEFIDQYELPYRLQKEFGLIRSRPGTVIERVTKVNEKYKYYGFRINHNTLLCESREELIGILNESGLGNRIYIGTEYDYSENGNKIIFIGMAKEQSNEIS